MKTILTVILIIIIGISAYSYGKYGTIIPKNIKNDIATTIKQSSIPGNPDQSKANETITGTTMKKVLCTLSGNDIEDNQYQNGLTFAVKGERCITSSGFKPGHDNGPNTITFNGITQTWAYASFSLGSAVFSPDGKHFAYTASKIPIPWPPTVGVQQDHQQFMVVDNKIFGETYTFVLNPQYSKDGTHFGYVALKGNQYVKVVDGVEAPITSEQYKGCIMATQGCSLLFGFAVPEQPQGVGVGSSITSPNKKIEIKSNFDIPEGSTVNCNMAACRIVVTVTANGIKKTYGPYDDIVSGIVFSPDEKHFAWIMGGQLYIDGVQRGEPYNEAINLSFSSDNKTVTYNARMGKTVYFVSELIAQ